MTLPQPARPFRVSDVVTIALFLGAILAPAVDQVVREDAERAPTTELRLPAPRPPTPRTWSDFSAYPAKYDAYFADSVGLRDVLLRWNSLEKLYVFDHAPTSTLFVGDDHWIFYTGEFSVDVYRGVRPFQPSELEAWKRQLELRRDALAPHGIRYLYVLVPNKETVYPERMPTSMNRVGPTRREQFLAFMKANSTVEVFDMTDALRAAKVEDTPGNYLYNQHGTHWTGRGGLTGYRALVEHLGRAFPELRPLPIDALEVQVGDGLKDTWAKSMYIPDVLTQRDVEYAPRGGYRHTLLPDLFEAVFTRRTIDESAGHVSAVLFHDSFGPYIWDLLAEHFARLCTRWGGYDAQLIASESPDVVVDMYVERVLVVTPPGPGDVAEKYTFDVPFEKLPHELFALDDARAAGVAALDGMPVRVGHDGAATTLSFTRGSQRQGAALPTMTLPATGEVLMRIDARAATPTQLFVYWKTPEVPDFKRMDSAVIDVGVESAPQFVTAKLPRGPLQFLLRPRDPQVEVTLRAIDVRSAIAP